MVAQEQVLMPKKRTISSTPTFILQFHITEKCDLNCQHCYVQKGESDGEMSAQDIKAVLDDFESMIKPFNLKGRLALTGGDPLLRGDVLELIEYAAKSKGLEVHLLGNPHHLTRTMAADLRKAGVVFYQQSIDGSREVHDSLRGQEGLYDRVFTAVETLLTEGIRPTILSTISRANAHCITDIMDECASRGVNAYNFSRLVPVGRGASLRDAVLSPEEFHDFLHTVIRHARWHDQKGTKTSFGVKDCLYVLAAQELGEFKPNPNNTLIYDGCTVGISQLTVIPDGTVYPCRRLPIKIGKVPEQKLWDIFLDSDVLNELRDPKKLEYCNQCDLVRHCRGCRAVAYATVGDYLARDPQCWKNGSANIR